MKWILVLTMLGSMGLMGCQSESDDVNNCTSICARQQECISADLDLNACVNNCVLFADISQSNARDIDDCNDCLSGQACGVAEGCFDSCPAF